MPDSRPDPGAGERRPPLVIVGASVRALADSARRSGRDVYAADLFRDGDLATTALAAVRVPGAGYPDNLAEAIRPYPPAPWCYSGALENHPALIDRIAAERPLAGNHGNAVSAVRDPIRLGAAVRAAGLDHPATFLAATDVPTDGSHLVKPLRSAGGRGIGHWHGAGPHPWPSGVDEGRVWQRFVAGEPWAAAFLIGPCGSCLIGASRQLLGQPWCHARPFRYCGSIDVPLGGLPRRLRDPFERLGGMLAAEFTLVGLVGADLVVDRHGRVHVIEINPRPTASMELIERATGEALVASHLAACGAAGAAVTDEPRPPRPATWSKAILFSHRDLIVEAGCLAALRAAAEAWTTADGGWPALADIPAATTEIAAGGPVLTVFAAGETAGESLILLRHRTAAACRLLSAGQSAGF